MAMQTSRLGLIKPEYNEYVEVGVLNENFDKLDEAYGELVKRVTPPDFDNLLMWPGCIRATPPKNGDTWVERIVTKADRLLRAERITVRVGESEYTETYRFYYEDGVTLKESYTIHTKQEEDGTWYEDITREGGDEPPGDTEPDVPVEPDEPTEPEEPVQALELELSDYEEGVDLYALIDDEVHTVANAEKNTATIDEEYMVFRIN